MKISFAKYYEMYCFFELRPSKGLKYPSCKSVIRQRKLINIFIRVVSSDSGNYSCRPSNAEADMVGVHVLEGTGLFVCLIWIGYRSLKAQKILLALLTGAAVI